MAIRLNLALAVGAAGVALAVAAALNVGRALERRSPWGVDPAAALVVRPATVEVGHIPRATERSVAVQITNNLDVPVQIVGGEYTCGPNGCFEPDCELPMTIAAGGTGTYKFTFKIGTPGAFSAVHDIYTSAGETLHVRLTGTVVRPPATTHPRNGQAAPRTGG